MLLTIETVDRGCSLAVARDGEIVDQIFNRSQVPQSRRLLPLVSESLERSGLELEDVDSIGVCKGPGAFTAIRLGVTAAKVLASTCEARLTSVSSLRLMATYGIGFTGRLWSVIGARRGEVYAQRFRVVDEKILGETDPLLLAPEKLKDRCADDEELLLLLRQRGWTPDLEAWPENVSFYPSELTGALAVPLVQVARTRFEKGRSEDPDALSPLYVRESDAAR